MNGWMDVASSNFAVFPSLSIKSLNMSARDCILIKNLAKPRSSFGRAFIYLVSERSGFESQVGTSFMSFFCEKPL